MKKVTLLLALVLGLSVSIFADNVIPTVNNKVQVSFNGSNHLVVAVAQAATSDIVVRIYNNSMDLVHSEKMDAENAKEFSMAKLPQGTYIVKLEEDGEVIYTEMVKNIR
ncbi:MAG: hypothetical protein RIS47_1700 [Bacteroidota bacterium]|jgi:ABC-type molybdate transport system substrate-binding protein